jgi:replicative DNA helicase
MVAFLYGHSEKDIKADLNLSTEIFVKVAKHRNGALANIKFRYDKDYQVFTDEGEGEMQFFNNRKEDNPF